MIFIKLAFLRNKSVYCKISRNLNKKGFKDVQIEEKEQIHFGVLPHERLKPQNTMCKKVHKLIVFLKELSQVD